MLTSIQLKRKVEAAFKATATLTTTQTKGDIVTGNGL